MSWSENLGMISIRGTWLVKFSIIRSNILPFRVGYSIQCIKPVSSKVFPKSEYVSGKILILVFCFSKSTLWWLNLLQLICLILVALLTDVSNHFMRCSSDVFGLKKDNLSYLSDLLPLISILAHINSDFSLGVRFATSSLIKSDEQWVTATLLVFFFSV